MYILLLLNFIVPFVMVLTGSIIKRHPNHNMGKQNGYSSPASRKSQMHWDYAQSIAPGIFIALGKYLFLTEALLNIIFIILRVSARVSVSIGEAAGFLFLIFGFYYTDSKINEKFAGQ
jgi:hypothetical protein